MAVVIGALVLAGLYLLFSSTIMPTLNRLNKRSENRGWRIDYFLVSEGVIGKVKGIIFKSNVMGSDHCPIELEISL